MDSFLRALPELAVVKNRIIPLCVDKGGFKGFDGRFVPCTSAHKMLAGFLQAGEAVVMKHANVRWQKELKEKGYNFKQVNFVHDEWQTVVYGTKQQAEEVGAIQAKAIEETGKQFGLFCPLEGSYSVGSNWRETH